MMKNTLKTLPTGSDFSSKQLGEALYSLWAMMDTYWFEWCVTLDTAKAIREKKPLFGTKVTGAIHKRHINDTFKSTIKRYLDNWKRSPATGDKMTINAKIDDYVWDDEGISFTYKGVPVELKFIERRYSFFKNPDVVYYEYGDGQMSDEFRIANPFEKYYPMRYMIK